MVRYRWADKGGIPGSTRWMKTNENGSEANIKYLEYKEDKETNDDIRVF
jgi:hypothetical protein